MPERKQEIRKRPANQRIDPAREESIVEELSQHLEDHHEELSSTGASESEMLDRVLGEAIRSLRPCRLQKADPAVTRRLQQVILRR
jgi:hypothetical protein